MTHEPLTSRRHNTDHCPVGPLAIELYSQRNESILQHIGRGFNRQWPFCHRANECRLLVVLDSNNRISENISQKTKLSKCGYSSCVVSPMVHKNLRADCKDVHIGLKFVSGKQLMTYFEKKRKTVKNVTILFTT